MTITFRPTAPSKLFWAGRPAMRIVQALHWLRDLLVREGESEQVKRKLAKLFEDPTAGPPLKADLIAGMTALPTWMWVFLKPLVESDADARRRHIDERAAADDHPHQQQHHHAGHDQHRQRRMASDDDQRHAAALHSKRKPSPTKKTRTTKRSAAPVKKK